VARTGKPVVVSTGMATLCDIERALDTLSAAGNDKVVLLHCVSNYPAKPEDYNLRIVQSLKATFDVPVGVSDHTPGIEMPKVSVAVGANMIEKHVTVDQSLPGPDHSFSVTPAELKEMISAIRSVEAMLGSPRKRRLESERDMAALGRRSLVAKTAIPAGGVVTAAMIEVKRPGSGLEPHMVDIIVGRKVRRDVVADEPFVWEMFLE
jgi:sialic acid synthase SpsE